MADTKEINKKENKTIKFIVISILIIAVISLIGFAFARYITSLKGNTTADIAKWSFKVNGNTNQNFVIDLANTRTGVEQEAEVQEGYIGPGTAGAFEIELDATGSEVSLEYNINLNVDYSNNEVFPKNLIFYTDSTMQSAIYHEDNKINLNGFIGWNDNSKVHTKTIYWKWDYETGNTQTEKNNNDIADSYWIGKPITLSMNVTAKQVSENLTTGQYNVTFDANGGTLQGYGNASTAIKQVTYGEAYGDLPTPNRPGYIFKGWNGKNLFDVNNTYSGHIDAEGNFVSNGSWKSSDFIECEANADYVFAYKSSYIEYFQGKIIFYDNNKNYISNNYIQGWNIYEVTKQSPSNAKYIKVAYATKVSGGEAGRYDIQLEKENKATEYEPYYIIKSTTVTQNKNHTLTAIWEPVQ